LTGRAIINTDANSVCEVLTQEVKMENRAQNNIIGTDFGKIRVLIRVASRLVLVIFGR